MGWYFSHNCIMSLGNRKIGRGIITKQEIENWCTELTIIQLFERLALKPLEDENNPIYLLK